jgi:hypothetical protein
VQVKGAISLAAIPFSQEVRWLLPAQTEIGDSHEEQTQNRLIRLVDSPTYVGDGFCQPSQRTPCSLEL